MIFVIHEHFASHHHFDLRLELEGVLKSWAIPREIPLAEGRKSLAVEVEDHPLDYADFEGEIPEGTYGAGRVVLWDRGEYRLIERRPDKLIADFDGRRLKGTYVLVFFKEDRSRNWLFFRKKQGHEGISGRSN